MIKPEPDADNKISTNPRAALLEALGNRAIEMAHDLNNLLAIIGGFSSLLCAESGLSPAGEDAVSHIVMACERAEALVSHILGAARHLATPSRTNLGVLLNGILGLNKKKIEGKKIVVRILECDVWVTSIETSLFIIFLNLVTNAIEASPNGGTISIFTRPGHTEGEVEVLVKDKGAGIHPEHLDKLFTPRFTTKTDGHGFGLFSVAQEAEKIGANVHVDSKPGIGATFRVCLANMAAK